MATGPLQPFSDDPLDNPDDDRLQRGPFVASLTRALDVAAAGHASAVFSLVGPWGAGKSTILSFVKLELRSGSRDWEVVDFNPWSYSDETSMQLGFFAELQGALQGKGVAKKARKAVGRLSAALAPYAGLAGSLVNVDGEALAKSLGILLDGDISSSKAFEEAKRSLADSTRPILLILDDLDRLDPAELVLVAKLVRLVGRLPNVFYLLSYDEETLLDVLRRTSLVGQSEARAKDYLEKIVQKRFDIPPLRHAKAESLVNDKLSALIARLGVEVDAEDRVRFRDLYQSVLSARLRTLRSLNRFFAQLDSFDSTLAVEVNVIDFILLTWIRVAEPRLYLRLFDKKDWALAGPEIAEERRSDFDQSEAFLSALTDSGVAAEHAEGVAILVAELFPAHRDDRGMIRRAARSMDDAARAKRLSHPDFFNRYFAYAVPDDDVSDIVIDAGFAAVVSGHDSSRQGALERALIAQAELVTRKLRTRNVPPWPLAKWLISMYDRVPDMQTWTGGARYHLEGALRDAILRIPLNEFDESIADIVAYDEGAQQVVEIGFRLRAGDYSGLKEASMENVEVLRDKIYVLLPTLIPRVLELELPAGPLEAGPDFWRTLRLWQLVEPGMPKSWLKQQVESGRWSLLDAVAAFVPSWRSISRPGLVHLEHVDMADMATYFDLGDVLIGLEDDLRGARHSRVFPREEEDSPEARRRVALLGLQPALQKRDQERANNEAR